MIFSNYEVGKYMKNLIAFIVVTMLAVSASAEDTPKTEDQKTLYAIGLLLARQFSTFSLTPAELEFVQRGITDGVIGKTPAVKLEDYAPKMREMANSRRNAYEKKLATASKELVENAVKEKGAVKTKSGLIYLPLREGKGTAPAVNDTVKVNYRGTLADGTEFDSSYKRGQPTEVPLNGAIKCWAEGLQMLKPGGKARLICPADRAYGELGPRMIPPNATLIFELELLEVKK